MHRHTARWRNTPEVGYCTLRQRPLALRRRCRPLGIQRRDGRMTGHPRKHPSTVLVCSGVVPLDAPPPSASAAHGRRGAHAFGIMSRKRPGKLFWNHKHILIRGCIATGRPDRGSARPPVLARARAPVVFEIKANGCRRVAHKRSARKEKLVPEGAGWVRRLPACRDPCGARSRRPRSSGG